MEVDGGGWSWVEVGACFSNTHCSFYVELPTRIQSITWLKQYSTYCFSQHGGKTGKALYKLMSNVIYGKAMENLRNRIDVRIVSNEKKTI